MWYSLVSSSVIFEISLIASGTNSEIYVIGRIGEIQRFIHRVLHGCDWTARLKPDLWLVKEAGINSNELHTCRSRHSYVTITTFCRNRYRRSAVCSALQYLRRCDGGRRRFRLREQHRRRRLQISRPSASYKARFLRRARYLVILNRENERPRAQMPPLLVAGNEIRLRDEGTNLI